jgi:lysophospholipase L1-like esterase
VHWGDTPRLLVPALVTGLKAWHLRDGSDFFPKANFESVVKSLPDGADVIVAFGEIDCREGLLLAVERARYANLDEAISTVVGIYVTVLRKLAAKRRFRIMVHPVPPVLNETRAVVVQFNAALQRAVEAAAPTLAWLDFFGALLAPSGEALAEGMALDGTHLSPDYLRHLEAALPG